MSSRTGNALQDAPSNGHQGLPHQNGEAGLEPRTNRPRENYLEALEQHCTSCGKNMQGVRSDYVSSEITGIMNALSVPEIRSFINLVNDYDENILDLNLLNQDASCTEIIRFIVRSLREYNLQGQKCYLCLLNYAFQRIGCSHLANEMKLIWNTVGRAPFEV